MCFGLYWNIYYSIFAFENSISCILWKSLPITLTSKINSTDSDTSIFICIPHSYSSEKNSQNSSIICRLVKDYCTSANWRESTVLSPMHHRISANWRMSTWLSPTHLVDFRHWRMSGCFQMAKVLLEKFGNSEKYCFDIEKSGFFRQFDQNQSVVNYFYFLKYT